MNKIIIDFNSLNDDSIELVVLGLDGEILFNKVILLGNKEQFESLNNFIESYNELILFNNRKFNLLIDEGFVFDGKINDIMNIFSQIKGEVLDDDSYSFEYLKQCICYLGYDDLEINLKSSINSVKAILYCYERLLNNSTDKYFNFIGSTLRDFILLNSEVSGREINIVVYDDEFLEEIVFEGSISKVSEIENNTILDKIIEDISIHNHNTFDIQINS